MFQSPPTPLRFPDQATESSSARSLAASTTCLMMLPNLHPIALQFHSSPEKLLNTSPGTKPPCPLIATRSLKTLSYANVPSTTHHKSTLAVVFQDDCLYITMIDHHNQGNYGRKGWCALMFQHDKSPSLSWQGGMQ